MKQEIQYIIQCVQKPEADNVVLYGQIFELRPAKESILWEATNRPGLRFGDANRTEVLIGTALRDKFPREPCVKGSFLYGEDE